MDVFIFFGLVYGTYILLKSEWMMLRSCSYSRINHTPTQGNESSSDSDSDFDSDFSSDSDSD